MATDKYCRECGRLLIAGDNISQGQIDNYNYRCRECNREHDREYSRSWREANPGKAKAIRTRHRRKNGHLPMNENKSCSAFLGVYVAERLLPHVFKNVVGMPYGNPGYDFICGGGYEIDVKSSCRHHYASGTGYWLFNIRRNEEADYFVLIAIDDRDGLNPEHVWLIPAEDINHLMVASISENTLDRWSKYELTDKLDEVISCCDTMKNGSE